MSWLCGPEADQWRGTSEYEVPDHELPRTSRTGHEVTRRSAAVSDEAHLARGRETGHGVASVEATPAFHLPTDAR